MHYGTTDPDIQTALEHGRKARAEAAGAFASALREAIKTAFSSAGFAHKRAA